MNVAAFDSRLPQHGRELAIFGGTPALSVMPPTNRPVGDAAADAVARVVRSGCLTDFFDGPEVARLEEEFGARFGAPHAVAVNSGTSAILVALLAHGVEPGDEVVVSPYSCIAPVTAVLQAGGIPVFADIDPETHALDPSSVRLVLNDYTRAVLPVHMYGYPADVPALGRICAHRGVTLIGDCCMAVGATVDDLFVGVAEGTGCYSFHDTKVVNAGQGGIVVTHNAAVAEAMREVRAYGMNRQMRVVRRGANCVMPEIGAALARVGLAELDEVLARQQAFGDYVRSQLTDFSLRFTEPPGYGRRVWDTIPIELPVPLVGYRDRVFAALRAENIPVTVPVVEPLYRKPFLAMYAPSGGCPNAEAACDRFIGLRAARTFPYDEAQAIVEGIRKVLSAIRRLDRLRPAGHEEVDAGRSLSRSVSFPE
ncbi:MAG: DegT/DnrJ/EryC1/StrS family aminotransferase [Acidimicrobiales bacterium]